MQAVTTSLDKLVINPPDTQKQEKEEAAVVEQLEVLSLSEQAAVSTMPAQNSQQQPVSYAPKLVCMLDPDVASFEPYCLSSPKLSDIHKKLFEISVLRLRNGTVTSGCSTLYCVFSDYFEQCYIESSVLISKLKKSAKFKTKQYRELENHMLYARRILGSLTSENNSLTTCWEMPLVFGFLDNFEVVKAIEMTTSMVEVYQLLIEVLKKPLRVWFIKFIEGYSLIEAVVKREYGAFFIHSLQCLTLINSLCE